MAKVGGPLYSMTASGQIGKAMVFAGWKGQPYVRKYFVPQNPQSDGQTSQRLIFSQGVLAWQDKTDEAKLLWDDAAILTGKTQSGFNYFMSEYIAAMVAGTTPPVDPGA